jgi:hypothetical protein
MMSAAMLWMAGKQIIEAHAKKSEVHLTMEKSRVRASMAQPVAAHGVMVPSS